MDTTFLAVLRRALTIATSRRGLLTGLGGGLLAAGAWGPHRDTEAKKRGKRRKKRNKKKRKLRASTNADASCPGEREGDVLAGGDARLAQTFTAQRSGQLVRAELTIFKSADSFGDYILQVGAVDAFGVPTSEVLAFTTVGNPNVPDGESTVAFTFANPATLEAGTQYALILTRPGPGGLDWSNRLADACPGRAFGSPDATTPFAPLSAGIDCIFTTFVQS